MNKSMETEDKASSFRLRKMLKPECPVMKLKRGDVETEEWQEAPNRNGGKKMRRADDVDSSSRKTASGTSYGSPTSQRNSSFLTTNEITSPLQKLKLVETEGNLHAVNIVSPDVKEEGKLSVTPQPAESSDLGGDSIKTTDERSKNTTGDSSVDLEPVCMLRWRGTSEQEGDIIKKSNDRSEEMDIDQGSTVGCLAQTVEDGTEKQVKIAEALASSLAQKPEVQDIANNAQFPASSSVPQIVFLPMDDPRVLNVAHLHPPPNAVTRGVNDLPPHPPNMFFSVNGQVVMPFLSLQTLRLMSKIPPSTPNSTSEEEEGSGEEVASSEEDEGSSKEGEESYEEEEEEVGEPLPTTRHVSTKRQPKAVLPRKNVSTSVQGRGMLNHICHRCGKGFKYPSQLNQHATVHLKKEKKLFSCQFCARTFSRKKNLDNHLASLHGNVSGVNWSRKRRDSKKESTSIDELPYKGIDSLEEKGAGGKHNVCCHCKKVFNYKCRLDRHMICHLSHDEKKFPCQFCAKRFAVKVSLDNHLASVHKYGNGKGWGR